jgi:AraC-like DNA-binding protein
MLHGETYLRVDGQPGPIALSAGDFVLVLHGRGHQLQDDLRVTPAVLWDYRVHEKANPVPAATASWAVLGGAYHATDSTALRLLHTLPPIIHVPREHVRPLLWTDKLLPIMADEMIHSAAGSEAIAQGIMHLLFALAVRRYVLTLPSCQRNKLDAFLDPEIGPALAVIHARFDQPWTVGALAREIAMSRSSFASKFVACLGIPPLEYVTRLRMEHAKLLLADRRHLLKEVARSVGYLSESAFSSAFRRLEGESPANYRKRATPASEASRVSRT